MVERQNFRSPEAEKPPFLAEVNLGIPQTEISHEEASVTAIIKDTPEPLTTKQRLVALIASHSNEYVLQRVYAKELGISKQRVGQYMHELTLEGYPIVSRQEHFARQKKERQTRKPTVNTQREEAENKIKQLRLAGLGNKAIVEKLGKPRGFVTSHLKRMIEEGKVSRIRKKRRTKEEIAVLDSAVKDGYDLNLTYAEIAQEVSVDLFSVGESLERLAKAVRVTRRMPRKKKDPGLKDLGNNLARQNKT